VINFQIRLKLYGSFPDAVLRLTCLLFLVMNAGCQKKNAELLVYNGSIYTLSDDQGIADAMVISSGKIVAVGKEADLRNEFTVAGEHDLLGLPVFPGFIDPHCHFYNYGLTQRQADLNGSASQDEIAARLLEHVKRFPGPWVLGRGWDQNDWQDKRFPDRKMLDDLFPDIPVYLVRVDGHAAWVNSKAMKMAGIYAGMIKKGGQVISDEKGPTGILIDNAMSIVEKLIPAPGRDEEKHALSRAEALCFSVGLTSVGDAGLGKENVILLDSMQKQGMLKIRIYAMLNPTTDNITYFISRGKYKTDKLTVRSIKLFADGALGSRGALLKRPYSDDPGNMGIQVSPTGFLENMCKLAYRNGYQVNTHCIGDSAAGMILHLYASIVPEHNDFRWRIEHAQVVDPADLDMFGKYAIIPSVQSTHATSDMYWAEERLGRDRIKSAYAYKSLLAQNGWLANGSDFPVESINPIYGFYAAVVRKDLKGYPAGGYMMQEALDRIQALKAMTIWAAKASFEEMEKGSLEPGKVADFVILDRDIMKVNEDSIPGTRVLETWIAGERVWRREKRDER